MDALPLPRSFYSREPALVAHALIGKQLIRILADATVVCRIVETEAYRGSGDAASHAYRGPTARNFPMFGPPGHAYVYFIYGVHWMFNIAAHPAGTPGAVLIRAVEPQSGLDLLRRRHAHQGQAARIGRPPLSTTPEALWHCYEALEQSAVRGGGGRQLVDLVTLVRHAINPDEALTPFQSVVMARYEAWLGQQAEAGVAFTPDHRHWLDRIAEHIAASLTIELEDFDRAPFVQEGGLGRAYQLFGDGLNDLLTDLNEKLVA